MTRANVSGSVCRTITGLRLSEACAEWTSWPTARSGRESYTAVASRIIEWNVET